MKRERKTSLAQPPEPADVMCQQCGWIPVEGMPEYLRIHGAEAKCLGDCGGLLSEITARYAKDAKEKAFPDQSKPSTCLSYWYPLVRDIGVNVPRTIFASY